MNDILFALRQLRKTPGFTAVALLTLAIGIGSCTAIFSVVNRVLLRPLDYPHPEQLVRLNESNPPDLPTFSVSVGDYFTWRAQATTFQELAASNYSYVIITGQGEPVRVGVQRVTSNFLATMGFRAALGRDFLPGEDAPGRGDVAILSEGLWTRQFGARTDIVGQLVRIDGDAVTIVGVMPPTYHGPDLVMPSTYTAENIANHGSHYLGVIGRMKPGVTIEQAHADLALISARLAKDFPDSNKGWTVLTKSLLDAQVGGIRKQLYALLAAVGFLLFIGCANVANLLLVRASSRSREIAIRSAVGASRYRVIRQLVVEHLVLALIGGVLGTLVAYWGLQLLLSLVPYGIPRSGDIRVDMTALAFSFGLSLLTGLVFGVVPAFQASRVDLNTVLKDAGRGTSEGRQGHRVRNGLVVAELTIAVILLVGAGLLMRSFARLTQVDPGFKAESAYTLNIQLPEKKYAGDPAKAAFAAQAAEKIAQIPGVTAAAITQALPFAGDEVEEVTIEGRNVAPSDLPNTNYYAVTPGYFKALGVPLVRGRLFNGTDTAKAGLVTIVSQSFARRLFPGEDPIGRRINIDNAKGVWSVIVGI
ncbi:MAG TPA: ABC transporter permease, partial [Opitutaceae bacterium]